MQDQFQTGPNEVVEKLAGRVALLNAENERLKKIVTRYERKIAGDFAATGEVSNSQTASSLLEKQREVDRLREIGHERLAEVEYWKKECAELHSRLQQGIDPVQLAETVKQEVQSSIQMFREEISKLTAEKNRLASENEKLRRGVTNPNQGKENQLSLGQISEVESSTKDYSRLIKKLKIEVEELREKVEVMKVERAGMVTREYHFEKLKELEVDLITSWSKSHGPLNLSNKSGRSRDMQDGQPTDTIQKLQQDLMEVTHENEKLVSVIKSMQERGGFDGKRTELEARRRMEGLETKINELIEENEKILRENHHLKSLPHSKLAVNGDSKSHSQKKRSSGGSEILNSEVSTRLKDLEQKLESKDSQISNQRMMLENRIRSLEKELREAKIKEVSSTKSTTESHFVQTNSGQGGLPSMEYMKQSLEEAYSLIMKLEKENNLLLSRIDHLETDNHVRVQDNQKLYALIESKNKVQETLIRERQESERTSAVNGDVTPGFGGVLITNHTRVSLSSKDPKEQTFDYPSKQLKEHHGSQEP